MIYGTAHKKVNILSPFDNYEYGRATGTGMAVVSAILLQMKS